MSVMLTHLREVIRGNLSQLLSYKDMRLLVDRLEPEYRRLVDEIIPSQLSYSGFQAVLKLLLAERISIRNLHLILESIAEVAPHVRRAEQLAEHVRMRMAQQICGDLSEGGTLKVLRLGNRWDLAFHQSLKRDPKGDVVEFDIDPRLIEQFGTEASKVIRGLMEQGHQFALVSAPDARPLCAHGDGAPVPDAAGPLASRDRARRTGEIAGFGFVIQITEATVFLTFLLFCRIGACIMLMPGFGSPRVPVNVRVFLAVSVTLCALAHPRAAHRDRSRKAIFGCVGCSSSPPRRSSAPSSASWGASSCSPFSSRARQPLR